MTGETSVGLSQLWVAFRRRRMWFILVAGTILVAAAITTMLWPPEYRSTGTILIEQQELPTDIVRSLVPSYATQRIQVIGQRVMTTDNLMGVIERFNLYGDMRKRLPREVVIARMRRDTSVQMISADVIDSEGRALKATIAFSLAYTNRSAEMAARVANELVSLYLQQNIDERQRSSHDAEDFLAGEAERLKKDINSSQTKLADFKRMHPNDLPGLEQLNLEGLSRIDDQIRDSESQIELLSQQVPYVDAQRAQVSPQASGDRLKALRLEYARAAGVYSADHPDVIRLKREIAGLEAAKAADDKDQTKVDEDAAQQAEAGEYRSQLEKAQAQLADAQQRYSADHPDVLRLKREIAALQEKLVPQPAPIAADLDAAGEASADVGDNPVYMQLSNQRQSLINQIKVLQSKRAALQAKRDEAEQLLAQAPSIERDYMNIVRDLDSAQGEYREIHQKQLEAQISQNLETERKGEKFTLIEPPLLPEEPSSPNRPMIMLFGTVLALAAGLGIVMLLESIDGTVRGRSDLLQLLSTPPLAVIPLMLSNADHAMRNRRRRAAILGAATAVIVSVVMIHLLYRPLDVLWSVALRRIGIRI